MVISQPSAPRLFLLSTRMGGFRINITAADMVVFYDQDCGVVVSIEVFDAENDG